MESCDMFIVGGGAAGLSAARAAAERGCGRILLADRKAQPGGILCQCLHRGFGSDLTGPEYICQIQAGFPERVCFSWNTTVLAVDENRTAVLSSPDFGLKRIQFKQMILAAGCREIPFGSLQIAGTRPGGIYTAGRLQQDMNLHGIVPEGPAVILGSGDVGLVVAWQLAMAGIEIAMLVEQREKGGGLSRNWKRLEGYQLPLRCRTTVSRTFGVKQLKGVNIRNLDTGTEAFVPCKTLVVAAGLVPEQELIKTLNKPDWLHLCGNCNRIHSVVEGVVQEGLQAGYAACEKLKG